METALSPRIGTWTEDAPPLENSLTLRDYIQILFRQRGVILTTIIIVTLTTFIGLKLQTKTYEASVKMLISAEKKVESPYYSDATYSDRNVEQTLTQSEIVQSDPVLMRVVSAQGLNRRPLDDKKQFASPLGRRWIEFQNTLLVNRLKSLPAAQQEAFLYRRAKEMLKKAIKVTPIRDTNMFTITVSDYNPIGAAILANTVSRAYVIFDLEQQLVELSTKYGERHPRVQYLRENIARMTKHLDGQPIDDVEAIGPASVKIIEQASVPLEPAGQPKALIFALALFLSVAAGILLAFVFEFGDQTIKMPRDVEQMLDVPCLGSVRRRSFWENPIVDFSVAKLSPYGHSYQVISDHLYLQLKEKGAFSLMIAPTLKAEDSATVLANLAGYLTQALKLAVLVVDADLRTPALHKIYRQMNGEGLAGYLEGRVSFKDVVQPINDNLAMVSSGTTELNPIMLFNAGRADSFIQEAREYFSLVLFRSPEMRNHKDAGVLARFVDALLVVITEGRVRKMVIRSAFDPLRGKARHTLGALLLNRTYPVPKWIYDMI